MEKLDPKTLKDLFSTLQGFELFPGDKTDWTAQLLNEEDLEGPVVLKDGEGHDKLWMDQDTYRKFLELKAPPVEVMVVLNFKSTDDKELTCFVCHRFDCNQEAAVYTTTRQGQKARTVYGKHSACKIEPVPR